MEKALNFLKNNKIFAVILIAIGGFGFLSIIHQVSAFEFIIRPYLYDSSAYGISYYPNVTTNYVSGPNMLMYFTILSNLASSVYLILIGVAVFVKNEKFIAFARNPLLSGMITMYIFLTGLIYCCVLMPFVVNYPWESKAAFNNILNNFQHIFMPILMTVLFFFPLDCKKIELKQIGYFMIFPLVYLFVSLMRGIFASDHWYPYPFLNAEQLWAYIIKNKPFSAAEGYPLMLAILIAILGLFIGVAFAIRALRNKMVDIGYGNKEIKDDLNATSADNSMMLNDDAPKEENEEKSCEV